MSEDMEETNLKDAWKTWTNLASNADDWGFGDLVRRFRPSKDAKWQLIDERTTALREALFKIDKEKYMWIFK